MANTRDFAPDLGFLALLKGTAMQVSDQDLREIDLASAPAFLAAICEMIDWADNRAVVIDCSAITFMDSSAFHALMDAHRYALSHDHLLVIRGLRPNCERAIDLCDDQKVLTIADVTEAELVAWTVPVRESFFRPLYLGV